MTAGTRDLTLHAQQDHRAQALGMSGAEVDAARRGWSFDVKTSIAIALAIASNTDDEACEVQRRRAVHAGLTERACQDIETLARCFASDQCTGICRDRCGS